VPSRARFPPPEKRNSSIFDVRSGLREFPLKYDNRRKWQKGAGRQKTLSADRAKGCTPMVIGLRCDDYYSPYRQKAV
jgi:hypothetical protein